MYMWILQYVQENKAFITTVLTDKGTFFFPAVVLKVHCKCSLSCLEGSAQDTGIPICTMHAFICVIINTCRICFWKSVLKLWPWDIMWPLNHFLPAEGTFYLARHFHSLCKQFLKSDSAAHDVAVCLSECRGRFRISYSSPRCDF